MLNVVDFVHLRFIVATRNEYTSTNCQGPSPDTLASNVLLLSFYSQVEIPIGQHSIPTSILIDFFIDRNGILNEILWPNQMLLWPNQMLSTVKVK